MTWRLVVVSWAAALALAGCSDKDGEAADGTTGDGSNGDGGDGGDGDGGDDGGDGTGGDGTGDGGDGGIPPTGTGPYRDAWVTEIDAEFPYVVDDFQIGITSITVGGDPFSDNFANRGDVIVRFDNDSNRITVEMRRFTWADSEDAARAEYAKMQLWAYSTNVTSPKAPAEMDPARDCTNGAWQDGCGIRVYYEGQIQPAYAGADFRVSLPAEYRHTVNVVTGDVDADADYRNPGDACIEGLNGTADVELRNGLAYVTFADDITPGPTCRAEEIEACETWTSNGQPAPWSPECPCQAFGRAKIETSGAGASTMVIDSPPNLWTAMTLENHGDAQSADGEHCTALIDWSTGDVDIEADPALPWRVRGEANHPSGGIEFAGYAIQAFSDQCAPVQHTDNPADYVGPGNGADQDVELRGDITVCNDCIRGSSCEDLLPGA